MDYSDRETIVTFANSVGINPARIALSDETYFRREDFRPVRYVYLDGRMTSFVITPEDIADYLIVKNGGREKGDFRCKHSWASGTLFVHEKMIKEWHEFLRSWAWRSQR